ncbi:MAG: cyclic pyranopterin monophosphate synthase MoaC [Xanthomonadales bacterium]|nr:Cyclic pyranopterin monophosphate synthase [Xanthomonadales bacterium]MCC6593111.1 cyclic pyranopterin monophosphate synthase MoaC [Xanthomonadales bacterium]MCE7930281.1 cyclic pyranopterin monophosphate synthase MoaC [Xanthomonadales bacterium PRO6]
MKPSHVDEQGRPRMVDVGHKPVSARMARAQAEIVFPPEVDAQLRAQGYAVAKGPVIATAIIAGVMGAKKTPELIPFCHPLGLDDCEIAIEPAGEGVWRIDCAVRLQARTGVEMEALTGAAVAALAVYDMCKALSPEIEIRSLRLVEKHGGKRDYLRRND